MVKKIDFSSFVFVRSILDLLFHLLDRSFINFFVCSCVCGRVVVWSFGRLVVCSGGRLFFGCLSSFSRLFVCSCDRWMVWSFGVWVVCSCGRVVV